MLFGELLTRATQQLGLSYKKAIYTILWPYSQLRMAHGEAAHRT
jgi:hypothetical protein